jgi:tetratricopeptide (TPR) repeat protein
MAGINLRIVSLLLASILFGWSSALAQQDKDLVAEADAAYNIGAKALALEQYELALKINPKNVRANFMAGKCILETIDKGRASDYLIKANNLDPNVSPDILFLIGQSFQLGKDFDKAVVYYEKHKEKISATADKKVRKSTIKAMIAEIDAKIAQCSNGKEFVQDPLEYAIKNLGDAINSNHADYAPAINKDESLIIFTSRREGGTGIGNVDKDLEYFEDIYISELKDGKWLPAKNIGTIINTENHDASIGLSGDGKELFLYKDDNGGDIYVSKRKDDGSWAEPRSISSNINSRYNENSVSISPDGQTLFFTSDRPGGKGGIDIYMSKLDKKGQWGKPTNLGAPINTSSDEDGPFIDYDGKTLYFSSRGHKGMGGYDIFVSEFDSTAKKWSDPVNIGYPINTPDDDIYFVKSGDSKFGYYASVKDGGLGEKDIYRVAIPDNLQKYNTLKIRQIEGKPATITPPIVKTEVQKPVILRLKVSDEASKQVLDALVSVRSKETNAEINISRISQGVFECSFTNATAQTYALYAEKEGYAFQNLEVRIPAVR